MSTKSSKTTVVKPSGEPGASRASASERLDAAIERHRRKSGRAHPYFGSKAPRKGRKRIHRSNDTKGPPLKRRKDPLERLAGVAKELQHDGLKKALSIWEATKDLTEAQKAKSDDYAYVREVWGLNIRTWEDKTYNESIRRAVKIWHATKDLTEDQKDALEDYRWLCDVWGDEIEEWVVSKVTDMSYLFANMLGLESLGFSNWDVSSVVTFEGMFLNCHDFEGEGVGDWKPQSAVIFRSMFEGASVFDQNLGEWAVYIENVRDYCKMFKNALKFTGTGLSKWTISGALNTMQMFMNAPKFDMDLGQWETGNIINMSEMFYGATDFGEGDNGYGVRDWELPEDAKMMDNIFKGCEHIQVFHLEKGGYWPRSVVTGKVNLALLGLTR